MDVSTSNSTSNPGAMIRSWYLHDGQIRIPALSETETITTIVLSDKDGQKLTPLQLIAWIQQEHPVIHNPAWARAYLPLLCPTGITLEEVQKHFQYFNKRNMTKSKHTNTMHKSFDLTSKKMAFHLGYTLQVLWLLAKRPCPPVADQPAHFSNTKPNIRHLAHFFGMLLRVFWEQRVVTAASSGSPAGTGGPTQDTPGEETIKFGSWKKSKGSMDNWRDLEGALATLWRIFTYGDVFKGIFMRDWEFIHLSAEEDAWFGISSDGPGKMSPLALGLKEAERVQRHWEKEKKWVDPMYPAEWEGWAVV
ncbi:hypothetical protein N0V85_008770 [Neurospora sp. IMI 360204]|nr:hypothetical protein N0V85_008770 [Neurospora sp. IMI 360204]